MSLQIVSNPDQTSPGELPAAEFPIRSPRVLKIAAGPAGAKGRGIFATAPIATGEVIEIACTVELSGPDCDAIAACVLDNYYFAHPTEENGGLLVMGLVSLSNHDVNANATRRWYRDPEIGWVIALIALRDIAAGEEVTHRYACAPWFTESCP